MIVLNNNSNKNMIEAMSTVKILLLCITLLEQKKVQCMTYSIILFCIVHPVFPLNTFSNTLNFILDGILDKKIHVHLSL